MPDAIYPLSADPITNGHLDIIYRAGKIFDKLVVAVGNNYLKNYSFNLLERKKMTQKVLQKFKNIEVVSFDGLLTDLAQERNINFIVRGFRNSNDYLHELVLYQNYLSQNSNLEFINLFSSNDFISSTAVKEMVLVGGEIHKSVPLLIKKALEKRLKNQTIIGLSGGIGSGKSTVSQKLIEKLKTQNLPAQKIDLDELGHDILLAKTEIEKITKQKIIDEFGLEIVDKNGNIDRSKLAKKVFSNKESLKFLTDLIHPLVLLKLRQRLQNMTGIIFLESAIWEEYNLTYLCNNAMILLENSPQITEQRLLARGLDLDQIQQRITNQFSLEEKKLALKKVLEKDDYGQIWHLKADNLDEGELDNLVQKIIKYTQNYV